MSEKLKQLEDAMKTANVDELKSAMKMIEQYLGKTKEEILSEKETSNEDTAK
jgi:hypothetical protein